MVIFILLDFLFGLTQVVLVELRHVKVPHIQWIERKLQFVAQLELIGQVHFDGFALQAKQLYFFVRYFFYIL